MLRSSIVVVSPLTAAPGRDILQQPAHDFPRARLRQRVGKADIVRRRHRANDRPHVRLQFFAQRFVRRDARLQRDKADDGLPLQLIGPADHRRLRHARMRDQRALHLARAEPVARHVQHVVDAPHDPEVAVLVAPRAVAGEVAALSPRSSKSAGSAPRRRRSSAAWRATACGSPACRRVPAGTSLPSSSTIAASTPKKGSVALPGLVGVAPGRGVIMSEPVSVCHHVSTIGQRPPPMTL